MRPIAVTGRELRWVKADRASGGGYQLRDGDAEIAVFKNNSWTGGAAAT